MSKCRWERLYDSAIAAAERADARTRELEGLLVFYQASNATLASGKNIAVETMAKALTDHNATLQRYGKDIHLLEDKLKIAETRLAELEGD